MNQYTWVPYRLPTRRYTLEVKGYDFEKVVEKIGSLSNMEPWEVLTSRKHPQTVKARSLHCHWATRELGISVTELSQKLRLSQLTVSILGKMREKIAKENDFKLIIK